jgi:hypothetical protein
LPTTAATPFWQPVEGQYSVISGHLAFLEI